MAKTSESQSQTRAFVRDHFRLKALSFDRLYDAEDGLVQRLLRPSLFRRRDAAVQVVREHGAAHVLDIGCGSGRVAHDVLSAGASRYVGVDFSEPMIDLARRRLAPFGDKVTLVTGDFLQVELDPGGSGFDVVIGIGLFDYSSEPERFLVRMRNLCRGTLVATFPTWTWRKGPIRYLRYEVINRCPLYYYEGDALRRMLVDAGFTEPRLEWMGAGYLVRAR